MDSVANDSQKIIVDLRRRLEALTAERDDALAQQAAATEVLQVINSSTGDLTPAFDMIVEKAVRLCDASGGTLWLVKDGMARATGGRNVPTPFYEYLAPSPCRSDTYWDEMANTAPTFTRSISRPRSPTRRAFPFSSPALISARRERF